jgi:aminoglycoside phosphotransferase family enzyme/predicted kinase
VDSVCERVVDRLLDPVAYPHRVGEIRLVETHISWVVLTGEYAYKLKKPVRLGFLDFSTPERRRHFCEEELRINRRVAPDLYLGIVPIGETADGLRVGAEPACEYAVKMRQFPYEARLDRRLQAGRFGIEGAAGLAVAIADFHESLSPLTETDHKAEFERTVRPVRNNFRHLDPDRFSDGLQQFLTVIESWTRQQMQELRKVFIARARQGRVRECHGDLHLENLLWLEGRFVMFDAIEFNPDLRCIDTANDIGFAAMDLMARNRNDLAYTLLNGWLEQTGDYDSLEVMRFYLVYRSLVRAVVTTIRQGQPSSRTAKSARIRSDRYIELAAELVDTPSPELILMHGFSGSGKTWLSERLVRDVPALRVRSDLERKRLPGIVVEQDGSVKIGEGVYREEVTDRTYRVLARHCETGLRSGFTMVADATFLHRSHRRWFIDLAERLGARVRIVACRADRATLLERIGRRQMIDRDASDASAEVLKHQMGHHDPLDSDERALLWAPSDIQ